MLSSYARFRNVTTHLHMIVDEEGNARHHKDTRWCCEKNKIISHIRSGSEIACACYVLRYQSHYEEWSFPLQETCALIWFGPRSSVWPEMMSFQRISWEKIYCYKSADCINCPTQISSVVYKAYLLLVWRPGIISTASLPGLCSMGSAQYLDLWTECLF